MRRNGDRLLIKLVCLWCFLGAYSYWKHSNWFKDTQTLIYGEIDNGESLVKEKNGNNRESLQNENAEHSAFGQNQGWRQFDAKIVHSRHLLAVLPNCTPRAVDHFPWDYLTEEQRKQGYIAIHVIVALYMFVALSIVCDRYFVPSLEVLCDMLDMQPDVAGATFMAAGSSAPELATAVIGVFITKADVGLSTVVGSAIYNVMFVISMSALFATSVVQLHWWPLFRDCLAYLVSVIALILIICDAAVEWYEPIALLLLYVLYVIVMLFNKRLELMCTPWVKKLSSCFNCGEHSDPASIYEKFDDGHSVSEMNGVHAPGETTQLEDTLDHAHQEAESWYKLCERPKDGLLWTVLWTVSMPLSLLLFFTVPDCRRPSLRRFFWVTFLMSLVWLGVFCFIMVWMITVVGYTLDIPDSVMSLTFIAFGVSLPDVVASVIVVRDGLGDMAMSNAVGSNVFDILVCLGVPWFIETSFKAPGSSIPVYSEGLLYSSIMLLTTVAFLLAATHLNGWRLTKTYGVILLVVYVIYTFMASLYELNFFGYLHPPECVSSY